MRGVIVVITRVDEFRRPGFIAGVTNPILECMSAAPWDLLCDIADCRMVVNKDIDTSCQAATDPDEGNSSSKDTSDTAISDKQEDGRKVDDIFVQAVSHDFSYSR